MATSLYQLLPWVAPEVQGCPEIVAIDAIRNAAIELCERGQALKVTLDPIDVIAGVSQYDLTPDDGLYPYHIRSCTYNGLPIDPVSTDQLDAQVPSWRTLTGTPEGFFRPDDFTMQLVYTPSVTVPASLYVTLNVAPTLTAPTIDDKLFQRHGRIIATGAKSKLMMINKVPWSNPELGSKYGAQFDDKVSGALASNLTDNNNVQLRARAPYKFA